MVSGLLRAGVVGMVVMHMHLGHLVLGAVAAGVFAFVRVATALDLGGGGLPLFPLLAGAAFFSLRFVRLACHSSSPSPRGCRASARRRDDRGQSPIRAAHFWAWLLRYGGFSGVVQVSPSPVTKRRG